MLKIRHIAKPKTVKRNESITQMADREIVDSLKKYVMLLNAEGISVNKAYLFGSYSDDTASEESDIDVLIVSDKYDDMVVGKIWRLTRKINTKIEPYFIGIRKFRNDDTSPLINLIKASGIEIA